MSTMQTETTHTNMLKCSTFQNLEMQKLSNTCESTHIQQIQHMLQIVQMLQIPKCHTCQTCKTCKTCNTCKIAQY